MSEARPEDDYFARLELKKKRKLRQKMREEADETALSERQTRHHHKCGKCGDDMETVPFRGVEIEICPSCGAVLLDSGELEQLAGSDSGGTLAGFFQTFFGEK